MDIVFPHLPRRVNPDTAAEPAGMPSAFDMGSIRFHDTIILLPASFPMKKGMRLPATSPFGIRMSAAGA